MPLFAFAAAALMLAVVPAEPGRAFLAERVVAARDGSTGADLADADRLAARARLAPPRLAARLMREARWAIPAAPRDAREPGTRVLGGERLRHAGRINSLTYASPEQLLSSSADGTARVWNLGNGREQLGYRGHPQRGEAVTDVFNVAAAAVGPGALAASVGNGEIHVWDRATGARARTIKAAPGATVGLAFTPDGRSLYSAGDDGVLRAFAVATGEPIGTPQPAAESRLESLAVDPAGKLVAVGTLRGLLHIHSVGAKGGPGARLVSGPVSASESAVAAVAFVPGSTNALIGARDGTVKLVAVRPAAQAGQVTVLKTYPAHPGRVQALATLPGGQRFVTASSDGAVRVWDLATGALKALYPLTESAANESDGGVTALAVAPDGSELAAGTFEGAIKLIPLIGEDAGLTATDTAKPLWAVAAGRDGRVAAAGADGTIRLYDAASGSLERTLPPLPHAISALAFAGPDALLAGGAGRRLDRVALADGKVTPLADHTGTVLAVAADPGRGRVYSGGVGRTLIEQSSTGEEIARTPLPSAVCAICLLPSGAVAVGLADGSLVLLEGGKVVGRASAHRAGTAGLAAGPGGTIYSVGGDGALCSWSVGPGPTFRPGRRADLAVSAGGPARATALAAVALSPDGKSVAAAGADGVIRVYSTVDLSETRSFRGHDGWVTGLTFTPDGRALFSAGADKTVRRFEMPRPAAVAGHAGPVTAVALSPDRALVATGSTDRSAKVWDRASGKLLATLPGPSIIGGVAFTQNGELVTAAQDGVVRWWDWRAAKELRHAVVPGEQRTIFLLAADPQTGKVAVVWGDGNDRFGSHRFTAAAAPDGDESAGKLTSAALSGDATRVAFASADGVRVVAFRSPEPPAAPWSLFPAGTVDLGLTKDGATLVSIGEKNGTTVDGIDLATAAKVAQLSPRQTGEALPIRPAIGLVVAPVGGQFLTWDALGGVTLYDPAGRELKRWKLPSAARVAAVSADAKTAVTGHRDGTATILELSP